MRAKAHELIDSFAGDGSCEFMTAFAEPYSSWVIAELLGIPAERFDAFFGWATDIGLGFGPTAVAEQDRIEAAVAGLHACCDELAVKRRQNPADDLISSLLTAEPDGHPLTDEELCLLFSVLVFAGRDTTRNQLGLAMQAFMDHPAQWRLLAERPDLAPSAVEEVMRISPTTTWVSRQAMADFTFDGLAIEAGTTIHLLCESAGTDPRSGHATAFDIAAADRSPHLAFGGGVHYCLGHLVARADMSEALAVLARRLREPRVQGAAVWLPCSGNTGPVRLPLAFTPGRA
jgi:cytochrome P450